MSVGAPACHYLDLFGQVVEAAFGCLPYQTGSSLMGKEWRDVDVRLILDDDEFEAMFGQVTGPFSGNQKWCALNMAFSALGERMTGLPIDFQIQPRTWANEKFAGQSRGALTLCGPLNQVRRGAAAGETPPAAGETP